MFNKIIIFRKSTELQSPMLDKADEIRRRYADTDHTHNFTDAEVKEIIEAGLLIRKEDTFDFTDDSLISISPAQSAAVEDLFKELEQNDVPPKVIPFTKKNKPSNETEIIPDIETDLIGHLYHITSHGIVVDMQGNDLWDPLEFLESLSDWSPLDDEHNDDDPTNNA